MKIAIINGSARKGNTLTAINSFIKGASEGNEIEDDTNPTIDKVAAADMILFATPVYWWGITAQIKQVIDKCYCRGMQMKEKKVGIIVIGGAPAGDKQYDLIKSQFDCIADYLAWDVLFYKPYSANGKDELAKDIEAMKEFEMLGKALEK